MSAGSDPWAYIEGVRDHYVERFREIVRERRQADPDAAPEVWVRPNPDPGRRAPIEPLCVDILGGPDDKQRIIMIAESEPPEGGLVANIHITADLVAKVYPLAWEQFAVWLRPATGTTADWSPLDAWRGRWIDFDRGAAPGDEDGLSGAVHYLSKPVAEGGGYVLEIDFGTAPLDALRELLDALPAVGAAEVELGRSDGTDVNPVIASRLERDDLSQAELTKLLARLIEAFGEVERVTIVSPDEIQFLSRARAQARTSCTPGIYTSACAASAARRG